MSQLTAWSPFFQSQARMRGRSLQLANKVKRLPPEDGELVRAQVQGEKLITVSVKSDGRKASIECDSPQAEDGVFCEHIWATLLHLIHEPNGPGASIDDIIKLRPQPPKARKRETDDRPVMRGNEPQWMGRLALLRPSATDVQEEAQSVFPVQRQVCYVVLPRASMRHNGLVVELRQRTATATGWGKPKPFKVSSEVVRQLTDPVDREICALLLGAVWVTEFEASDAYAMSSRSHAMYRVAPQAQRALLKQMIATDRCYLDPTGDEDRTDVLTRLTWDPGENDQDTWVLYLHAVYDEQELDVQPETADDPDAEQATEVDSVEAEVLAAEAIEDGERIATPTTQDDLLIDLQMRRAGRRVSIEVPELLLGGPDGLVIHQGRASLFDDREAWRWVAQFRDGRYIDDQTGRSVLRVEAEQTDRFLDRLYMLPHLPELDLPESLGRAEQTVEPVPHVDLFSPTSAPAMELASNVAKNHVVARLWFAYGQQRVSPVQPGRFVPVAPTTQIDGPAASEATDTTAESAPPAEYTGHSTDPATLNGEPHAPAQVNGQPTSDEEEPPANGARLIRRNRRAERQAINVCSTLGMRHIASPSGDALLLHTRLMPNAVGTLLSRGWVVSADQRLIRTAGPPALSITSGIDWFELRGNVTFTGEDGKTQEVALPEILAAARAGRNMVTLGDGTQGLLPQQWLEEHGLLAVMGQINGDHIRFRSSQAAMLDALLDDQELLEVDQAFAQARQRLRTFDGIEPLDAADKFLGSLRGYQRHGLGWLGFLRQFGMGGILADDMGLGKTVQVLAMIQARRLGNEKHLDDLVTLDGAAQVDRQPPQTPSMIVVPRSVVFNWVDEARKFTPDLKVLAYTGPDRDQYHDRFADFDLIVTSYGLMRRDIEVLKLTEFDYAVLDEAQAIKNPQSQSAKAARLINARHRLALTGTPIENHLGDLWSIFEYLNPGMLGSSAKFAELIRGATNARGNAGRTTATPGVLPMDIDAESADAELAADQASGGVKVSDGAEALRQIASALRPFILRRTKRQVLDDLPEKTEQTIICEMDPEQRRIYDQLRTYYRGNLMQQIDSASGGNGSGSADGAAAGGGGLGRAAFMVLEALLRLRQAACHPALIDKTSAVQIDRENAPSAKLDELEHRLDEIIDEGSKALVFSQFTSMLALIRKRLDQRGIKYAYLDGQTRNRKDVVERFQEDPDLPVFLISLKAGGVGLNLTAAEYVFIMDPWWNPAVEAQAIDRTHRIGQKKPVFAYRLICEDTVEQRILELQSRKRDLADAVVGGEGNILANLSRDDLERLLS